MRVFVAVFLTCAVLVMHGVFYVGIVSAEPSNKELLDEIRQLRQIIDAQGRRIAQLEEKASVQEDASAKIELGGAAANNLNEHMAGGVELGFGATFVMQGTSNANGDSLSQKGEDITDASYSFDLAIEKEFEDYGAAFVLLEAGEGAGVEDELKLFSNVNFDATGGDAAAGVVEAWYEQYLGPVTVTFGKLDGTVYIDSNEYANDECSQFLGRMFRNSPAIEFPDNTGGIRAGIVPSEWFEAEALVMDADSDWEDVADEIFFAGQINIKPQLFDRDGNYRLLGWINTADHTKWADATQNKENGYGIGISVDQGITDIIGVFVRYGWQDSEQRLNGLDDDFSVEHAWSAGIHIEGQAWGREEDVCAAAIGQIFPSDDYKEYDSSLNAEPEGHFEIYYAYRVNEHLTITPDFQVIWNPYGDDASNGNDTILAAGVRAQVDF